MRRNEVLRAMLETTKLLGRNIAPPKKPRSAWMLKPGATTWRLISSKTSGSFWKRKYGRETVQQKGLRVYTTLNINMQRAAQEALRKGLSEDSTSGADGAARKKIS